MIIKKITSIAILIFLLAISNAWAARLYFDAPQRDYNVGDTIPVRVFIDTEGESINAIGLKINYPEDKIKLESVGNGNSIINFWVNILTGVVVGGYQGDAGLISQLNFKALTAGAAAVSLENESEVYLNDGQGTRAALKLDNPVALNIGEGLIIPQPLAPTDTDPPEDFTPVIAQSPDVFDNKYFLVFSTVDKGSGLDHYEVQETAGKEPSEANWKTATSPYLLSDQNLTSYIFVKAVDEAGNQRTVALRPKIEAPPSLIPWWYWLVGLLIILALVWLGFVIIRKRRSKE